MKWLLSALIIPAGIYFLCAGCEPAIKKEAAHITPRNTAVNKTNAYNDLFLDSAAVEKFITRQQLNDTVANTIRSFYNARNFEYAWFDSQGLTEQALGFRSLYHYSHDTTAGSQQLETRLDELASEEDTTLTGQEAGVVKTELQLTRRFITFALNTDGHKGLPVDVLEQFIPIQRHGLMELADSVLANDSRAHRAYEAANPSYGAMKEQLAQYVSLTRKGGWPAITADKKRYKQGDQSPVLVLLKKRLQVTGELAAADSSQVFDTALETAVKTFQSRHGYTPTGVVTDTLLREMNIPAQVRLQQLLINMERMRWMPAQPEGKLIIVNIPEFMLHVWEGKQKAFDMAVVVGKEGHSTTMFSGDMNQVVFNPYWHVPRSIVQKEILPAIAKDKNYLEKNEMEITGERNGLPVVRQLPGEKNALGRVKFLFPNSFNIYFHDTPVKSLFERDKRAYSHGCIRLSDPVKMANYALQGMPKWTPEKIDSALTQGDKEKYIKMKDPIPVLVTYYTAWVDEQGVLQFREDIYGHDARMAQKMFSGNNDQLTER